jgi:hypothetical protein
MASLSVTFTGTAQDLDDFCTALGYTGPETKAQFFQNKVKAFANDVVANFRRQQQRLIAETAAVTSPTF